MVSWWRLGLGALVCLLFWERVKPLIEKLLLAVLLLALLAGLLGEIVVVQAKIDHMARHSQYTASERRHAITQSVELVTTTRSSTAAGDGSRDWRGVRRAMRRRAVATDKGASFHFVVDGYAVHSGLPTADELRLADNTILIYSGGSWAGLTPSYPRLNQLFNVCSCTTTSQLSIRAAQNLRLPMCIVGFDAPTSKLDMLNIGQADDSAILSHVYDTVHSAHPKARIILGGDCLGSLRLLNWLATRPSLPALRAIVLESPLPSLRHFLNSLTPFRWINSVCNQALCVILPNYFPELEAFYAFSAHAKSAFPDVPTFIGVLEHDAVSHPNDLPVFRARLHQVETFVAQDTDARAKTRTLSHGQIVKAPTYQNAVRQFLARLDPVVKAVV